MPARTSAPMAAFAASAVPTEQGEKHQAVAESGDSTAKAAAVEDDAPTTSTAAEKKEAD